MEFNKQDKSFKTIIDALTQILGANMVLETFGTQFKDHIDNDKRVGHDLIVGSLTFRNITVSKDASNLYLTESYLLGRSNLDEEIDMILNRECLFHVAQAYELVETLLYDIVADMIFIKGGLNIFVDNTSNTSDFKAIRKALKGLGDRQNNKHLIGIIRANCETFRSFETQNIHDIDFGKWYQILGEIRHCVTHSGMLVDSNLKHSLSKHLTGHVNTKVYQNKEYIYITPPMCRNLLSRIADFAFFCYKSTSEETYSQTVNFQNIEPILRGAYS
ncbi:MAG: hypothetical protein JWM44_4483 [Bacilli bacterium]|nr:hypothetical protein [Bacilli bacterium]